MDVTILATVQNQVESYWNFVGVGYGAAAVAFASYAVRIGATGPQAVAHGATRPETLAVTGHSEELDQLDADGEPPEFDLTPRAPARRGSRGTVGRGSRRWVALGVLVVLAAAAGFLVSKALGGATDYFYQVDEAVAQRPQLGTRRFRIQGTVTDTPQGVRIDQNTRA